LTEDARAEWGAGDERPEPRRRNAGGECGYSWSWSQGDYAFNVIQNASGVWRAELQYSTGSARTTLYSNDDVSGDVTCDEESGLLARTFVLSAEYAQCEGHTATVEIQP
jgi:hypothetical protein